MYLGILHYGVNYLSLKQSAQVSESIFQGILENVFFPVYNINVL